MYDLIEHKTTKDYRGHSFKKGLLAIFKGLFLFRLIIDKFANIKCQRLDASKNHDKKYSF
jgi:hypothetical protein